MKKRPYTAYVVLLLLSDIPLAYADLDQVVIEDIRSVCTQPSVAGQRWTVKGSISELNGVTVNVGALRSDEYSGDIVFTREEWSGVQQVLADQQASDNANYRECVRDISRVMLDKVRELERFRCDEIREQERELIDRRYRYRNLMDRTSGEQHARFKALFQEADREVSRLKTRNGQCFN